MVNQNGQQPTETHQLDPQILEKLKNAGITQSDFQQIEQAIKTYSIADGSPVFSETEEKVTKEGKTQLLSHQTVPLCASCSRVLAEPKEIAAACGICQRPLGKSCGCSDIACIECGQKICARHRVKFGMNSWVCHICAGMLAKPVQEPASTIAIPTGRRGVGFGDTVKVQCAWCGMKEPPFELTAGNGYQVVACQNYLYHVTVVRMFVSMTGALEILTAPVKLKGESNGNVELPDWVKAVYLDGGKVKMLKSG